MVKGAFPYVFVVYLWFLVHDFVWWFVWMCMESYYEAWKVGYYHLTGNSGCGVTNFFTAQGFCWFYIGLCWVDCHSIAKFIIEFCIWPAVYCTTPGFIRTLPVFTFKRPVTSPPKNGGTRVLEPEWVEKWLLLSVCCAMVDTRERSLSRETKHPDGWERSGVRLLSTLHYRLSSEN